MLGQGAVLAPFQMGVEQIAGHGFDIKADGLQRVAHQLRVTAGLALGTRTALGTQHTAKGETAAARHLSFHRIQAR